MKIFKRNQLIILVIALMLITAGYLNYSSKNNEVATSEPIASTDATLGDATLVNANVAVENTVNEIVDEVQENTVETASINEDDYFINSKLERTAMYSELLETYQELYNNSQATAEEKKEALNNINEINNTKNSIMIAENLISAKGINNVVVFVNDDSVSVIVGGDEVAQEQIAQIQNIISRELNVEAEQIHISNK